MSRQLSNDLIFNFLYHALNVAFPVIAFPYVARTLSVESFGAASLALTMATYFATIASLGIPIYGVREVARAKSCPHSLNRLATELLLINGFGVLVSVILFIGTVLMIDSMRDNLFLFLFALINVVLSFFQVDWLFQGTGHFKILAIRGAISKTLALILIFTLVNGNDDSAGFVIANVAALSFANVLNVFYARKLIKLKFKNLNFRQHVSSIVSFSATRLASSVYTLLDSVMLSILANIYYVGLYAIAIKLVRVIIALLNSASSVFFSRLSIIQNDEELYQKKLGDVYSGFLIISLPVFLGLLVFSNDILLLFAGTAYIESASAMKVLSVLVIVSILTSFIGVQVLYVKGDEAKVATSLFYGAVVCILFNFLLVPQYKHLGASVSTVLAEIAVLVYQMYHCRSKGYDLSFMYNLNSRRIYFSFFLLIITSFGVLAFLSTIQNIALKMALASIIFSLSWPATLLVFRERITTTLAFNIYERYK
mgnify:CR=1 FL=1